MEEIVRPSLKEINNKKRKIQECLRILRFQLNSRDISEDDKNHILFLFEKIKQVDDIIFLEKLSQVSSLLEPDKLWKLSEIEDVFM